MIGFFLDYDENPKNYIGFYGDLFKSLKPKDARDFIVKYAEQAGITESENEAHRFADGLFAAEEHLEGNIALDAVLAHYEIEQGEPLQEVETGLDKFGETEVLELEGDGYSDEQQGKLHDFIHDQQSN